MAHETRTLTPVLLWFGMMAGPVVWFAHFTAIWAISEFGCRAGLGNFRMAGAVTVNIWMLIATLIALPAVIVAGVIAYRNWRALRDEQTTDELDSFAARVAERQRFMAMAGIVLSIGFFAVILLTALPPLVIGSCGY